MKIPVLCLIGRSGTGKTTVIERLIPLLKSKGVSVATIKHHNHDFEMDRKGKDTYRHKEAGARIAMIVSPRKLALVEDTEREPELNEIVDRYIRSVDFVIVEGFKTAAVPKIEVYNFRDGVLPLALGDNDLLAIVSDRAIPAPVPVFLRDDVDRLAGFIIEKLRLGCD